MAYFLVMGGLALTVCVTFGWAVWRMLRWACAGLGRSTPSGGRKKTAARGVEGSTGGGQVNVQGVEQGTVQGNGEGAIAP